VRVTQLIPTGPEGHRPALDLNRVESSARVGEMEGGNGLLQSVHHELGGGGGRAGGGTFSSGMYQRNSQRESGHMQPIYQEWLTNQGIQNQFLGPVHQPRVSQRELLRRNQPTGVNHIKRGSRQPQRSF
jgi:hypothetical protein